MHEETKVLSRLAAREIEQAQRIRDALGAATETLERTIEVEMYAQHARNEAADAYQIQEDELLSLAYSTGEINGKNGDIRKAQEDALLVLARTHGTLQEAWQAKVRTAIDHDNAVVNKKQAETRFSGVKHAAMLTGSMLQLLAG
jgi:hypothetical protein